VVADEGHLAAVASARGVDLLGVVVSPADEVGVNDSRLCILVHGMYTSYYPIDRRRAERIREGLSHS
jgi:hypothetical protein